MKKYVIIVLNQVTVKLQYKFNMGVAFISRTIPIFMSYFLWNNIYNSMNGNKVGNYTRGQMLTYIILVNLTNFLFNFRHMRELGKQIQEGTLTTLLLRPVSILNQSFATFIGDKFFIIGKYEYDRKNNTYTFYASSTGKELFENIGLFSGMNVKYTDEIVY